MNKKITNILFTCLVLALFAFLVYASTTFTANQTFPASNSRARENITLTAIITNQNNADADNLTINITQFWGLFNNGTVYLLASINRSIAGAASDLSVGNASLTGNVSNFTVNILTNLSGVRFPSGIYNITVNATAANGTVNGSSNITNFTIDNLVPQTITLNGPANNTQYPSATATMNFSFNFTATDGAGADGSGAQKAVLDCNVTITNDVTNTIPGNAAANWSRVLNGSDANITRILPEGRFRWYVECTDNATSIGQTSHGNVNRSAERYLEVDESVPTPVNVTFESESLDVTTTRQVKFGKKAIITCKGTDTIDNNLTKTVYVKKPGDSSFIALANLTNETAEIVETETESIGRYDITCNVTDNLNNTNGTASYLDVVSFITKKPLARDTGEAKKIVGEGTSVELDLNEEGTGTLIAKTGAVTFEVAGEDHKFEVVEFSEESATIRVSSEPFEVTVLNKEEKAVDVNGDSKSDISILYNGITRNKADITFKPIISKEEEVVKEKAEEDKRTIKTVLPKKKAYKYLWLGVIAALVVIALLVFFKKREKGKVKFTERDLGLNKDEEKF